MRHLVTWSVCATWLVSDACANAADLPLFKKSEPPPPAVTIPWDDLNENAAKIAKQLIDRPTVATRGPAETFACTPEQYYWLLDNPDRAVVAWRRLGAPYVPL